MYNAVNSELGRKAFFGSLRRIEVGGKYSVVVESFLQQFLDILVGCQRMYNAISSGMLACQGVQRGVVNRNADIVVHHLDELVVVVVGLGNRVF